MNEKLPFSILEEHRFWLQIMGDHARFIFYSLAPNETGEIPRAQNFIMNFDRLLAQTRQNDGGSGTDQLHRQALNVQRDFHSYLLQLLALSLSAQLQCQLSPYVMNQMVGESEEYLSLMHSAIGGLTPEFSMLHHHLFWLPDGAAHAKLIGSKLDSTEEELAEKCRFFQHQFICLYSDAVCLNGFTRTKLRRFPALDRFSARALCLTHDFIDFLDDIKDLRKGGSVLGTLSSLEADHMLRESAYYLSRFPTDKRDEIRSHHIRQD